MKIHEIKIKDKTRFVTQDQLNALIENKIPYTKTSEKEL